MADSVGGPVFPRTGIQEGHLHFDKFANILYVYNGGNPANNDNWSEVGGSGAVVAGGIGTTEPYMDPLTMLYEFDDFISQSTILSTVIGKLGFELGVSGDASVRSSTGYLSHPGCINFNSGTAAPQVAIINALQAGEQPILTNEMFKTLWIVKPYTIITNTTIRFGIADNISGAVQGVYFEKGDTDTTWFAVTVDNSVVVRTNTNIVIDDAFHNHTIRRINAATVGFKIDNNAELVVAFGGPSGSTIGGELAAHLRTTVGANKGFEVDFVDILITGLSR